MVELGGVVQFCDGTKGRCLGAVEGRQEEVVCSFSTGMIAIYNVITRHCTKSWQLTSTDKMSISATFDPRMGLYVAVKNDNELITWKPEVEWSSDFNITQLAHPVHSMLFCSYLSSSPDSTHIAVIYKNSTIEIITLREEEIGIVGVIRGQRTTKRRNMKVYRSLYYTNDGLSYILLICYLDVAYCCILYIVGSEEIKEISCLPIESHQLGQLLNITQTGKSLISTWSSSVICKTELTSIIRSSMFSLHSLINIDSEIDPQTSFTGLTNIGDDYFITVVPFSKCSSEIRVYGVKYCTLQASMKLDETFKPWMLTCCHGYLFVLTNNGVIATSITLTGQCSLATALGRLERTDVLTTFEGGTSTDKEDFSFFTVSFDLRDQIQILETSQIIPERLNICSKLLRNSSSLQNPLVLSKVVQIAKCLLGEKEVERRKELESDMWYHDELMVMITSKVFPVSLSGTLFNRALYYSDWNMIAAGLKTIDCIPEEVIVDLLEAVLRLADSFSVEVDDEILSKSQLFMYVLALPKNDALIQYPLTRLSHDIVQSFLEILDEQVDCSVLLNSSDTILKYEDLIDWISLVLDTHFTSLILIPSMRPLIIRLREKIRLQVLFLSRFSILGGLDSLLKQLSKTNDNNWFYKMDRLEIDF